MTPSNFRAILAGGIGSGKSAAGSILAKLGARVIDADAIGHEILDGPACREVAARWPQVMRDGRVDRSTLARIVFASPSQLRELERITHPLIRQRIIETVARESGPVVVEVPLPGDFLGPGWFRLVIDAPERVRIERLLRRGMPPQQIVQRMATQPMPGAWRSGADTVIDNIGSITDLEVALAGWWRRTVIPDAAEGSA
jgi:dephospho-CoA kinase